LIGPRGANPLFFFPPFQDMSDYVFNQLGFSGTSAAAPEISGVVALMLSANPNLNYRDVQQILIFSSRHFDFADPDLRTNGAGLWVSHNDGFGVPDAGMAVNLARRWVNRPPLTNISYTSTSVRSIPDNGLKVEVSGNVPKILRAIDCLPSTGPHPDEPTALLPLVDVGDATNAISLDLTNKGALIQRGGNTFADKINFAAQAGAAFSVVYNFATNSDPFGAPGGDQLIPLGGTDYVPIPAVFIGHTAGAAMKDLIQQTNIRARLRLQTVHYSFDVRETLQCEHVSVRVKTDHQLRGDVRITLVSPSGTRSVLQRYNADENAGPVDWTYYSVQHFYESSAGTWNVYFSDEGAGATGSVHEVTLAISGVSIEDRDADGLEDSWERAYFRTLAQNPWDDPDHDGFSNLLESLLGSDPNRAEPLQVDLSRWTASQARLSWPGSSSFSYEVWGGTNVNSMTRLATVPGVFPETEWFTPYRILQRQFFRVKAVQGPQ
jgi:subtilisin-like proprotein convertase family protein